MKYILYVIISVMFATVSTQAYAESDTEYIDNLTGMRFKLVQISDEKQIYMGVYEVKQGEWQKVIKTNPSHFRKGNNYPVENVTSADAKKFIAQLRAQTGIAYRLPSSYEWSASVGDAELLNAESTPCLHANFYDNKSVSVNQFGNKQYFCSDGEAYTAAAGSYFPNENGLYDMFGNVAEWCCDPYNSEADNQTQKYGEDYCKQFEKSGLLGVAGGNFSDGPNEMKSPIRNVSIGHKFGGLGFRLAIDADEYEGEALPKRIETN